MSKMNNRNKSKPSKTVRRKTKRTKGSSQNKSFKSARHIEPVLDLINDKTNYPFKGVAKDWAEDSGDSSTRLKRKAIVAAGAATFLAARWYVMAKVTPATKIGKLAHLGLRTVNGITV